MLKVLAPAAVLVAGICTTAMSWRFAFQLGTTPVDSYTWAIFSVALDVTKWFMLPSAAVAWSHYKIRAAAAISIWLFATVYSFTAAMGFAALNRDATVASRQQQLELRATLKTMQQSPLWTASAACADTTTLRLKEYCTTYRALADRVTASAQVGDPQSLQLAQLTGISPETAQFILCLFLAATCEIVSALGFFALLPTTAPIPRMTAPPVPRWRPAARGDIVASQPVAPWRSPSEPAAARPSPTWKNPR